MDAFFGSEACGEEEEDDLEVTECSFIEEVFEFGEERFNFIRRIVEGIHRSSANIFVFTNVSTGRTLSFSGDRGFWCVFLLDGLTSFC